MTYHPSSRHDEYEDYYHHDDRHHPLGRHYSEGDHKYNDHYYYHSDHDPHAVYPTHPPAHIYHSSRTVSYTHLTLPTIYSV